MAEPVHCDPRRALVGRPTRALIQDGIPSEERERSTRRASAIPCESASRRLALLAVALYPEAGGSLARLARSSSG
jgi:hypothetical protein